LKFDIEALGKWCSPPAGSGLGKILAKDICFPTMQRANVSTLKISHFSHYESFLCLDLIAACAGLVSHIQAAAYKETDRGIYIILFFLQQSCLDGQGYESTTFAGKKNRNQICRKRADRRFDFLLMSNVITFFFLPLLVFLVDLFFRPPPLLLFLFSIWFLSV
jgi:hypothetical protein